MRTSALFCTALLATMLATQAHASITEVDTSHNNEYQQTGQNTVTYVGSFFGASLIKSSDDPRTDATVTTPGSATPQALSQTAPNTFNFQTNYVPTIDTTYPPGAYSFTLGSDSVTTTIPSTIYPTEVPTIANYDAFTTLDPTQAFTVNLTGGFTPQGTESFTFFRIFDQTTNTTVFNEGFLDPSTTSFNIGANTLTAGDDYYFETIFDNRFADTSGSTAMFNLYDTRTYGTFSLAAAVPESSTWAMMIAGVGMVGGTLRRRRIPATALA